MDTGARLWSYLNIIWNKNAKGDLEKAPPLYSYFKKLTKQSEVFLGGVGLCGCLEENVRVGMMWKIP